MNRQKELKTVFLKDCGVKMKKIEKNLHYLPFILLGIALAYFHLHMETNYGDDVIFREIALAPDFHLFPWLIQRYQTWSSRTLIEMLLMIMVALPQVVWKVLDAAVMTIAAVFISKIFCGEEYKQQKNWIIACLSFTIYAGLLKEAGWIATTVNYIWPLTSGIVSAYSIKKIFLNKKIEFFESFIYSLCLLTGICSEQVCIVLLVLFVAANFIWYKTNKEINIYLALQAILCIAGLVNILVCPGNAVRMINETANWFPIYADFGFLKKVELGISYVLRTMFLQDNIWMLIFLILLCSTIWLKYNNWIYRLLAIFPAASVTLLRHAHRGRGDNRLPFNIMGETGVFREDMLGSFKTFMIYIGLLFLCCVILIDIYIVFGNTFETLLAGGIFLLGLMTRGMMGFSPTIWRSGERTAICLVYSLLCCSVLLINTWDFREKKLVDMMYLFSILVAIGGFIDNYNFIFLT